VSGPNAFYDFSVSPFSYDFVSFLVAARGQGCKHVVFVPGKRMVRQPDGQMVEFQKCTPAQQAERLDFILKPLSGEYTVCETRDEARKFSLDGCFPYGYTFDKPVAAHTPAAVMRTGKFVPLKAKQSAIDEVANDFSEDLVTLTIRQSSIKPQRNSNIREWIKIANELASLGLEPVFIPDSEHQETRFGEHRSCKRAATDVQYRLAMYDQSALNMGVNNGPLALCFYSQRPFLQFKPMTTGCFETSPEFWAKANGVRPGTQPQWFAPHQRIVWADDTFEVMRKAVHEWLALVEKAVA